MPRPVWKVTIFGMILFVCFSVLATFVSGDKLAPTYRVNLDLSPADRWTQVVEDYKHYYPTLLKEIEATYPKALFEAIVALADDLEKYVPYPYVDEIKGIAAQASDVISLGELFMANVYYDLTAYRSSELKGRGACTSIVAADSNGILYHGRNLDYSFSKTLEDMTINVQFERGGKTVFMGTTYAGYIGLMTGCRPNGISISLDERDQGDLWMNVVAALKDGTHGIASFFVRDVLQNTSLSFEEAVNILSFTPLIAPSYLIVGGVYKNEAVVITRDRDAAIDQWYINPDNGKWYILETNYDHWKPAPDSDNRRDPGIKAMNSVGRDNITPETLFKVLSTPPVLNDGTTYTTIMCTIDPKVYNTTIRGVSNLPVA